MTQTIQLGDLSIRVTKKNIKHVHLSVHPPDGRVTLTAPSVPDDNYSSPPTTITERAPGTPYHEAFFFSRPPIIKRLAVGGLEERNAENPENLIVVTGNNNCRCTPSATRLDVARAYAISRLGWIRRQQAKMKQQARETPRQFVERESHYLWGRRHLMVVVRRETKPFVSLDHKRITLTVRPGSDARKRADVIHEWHKSLLHAAVPVLIKKWEPRLKVKVTGYFLQRMKTKWGSCNHRAGRIRLNTELVKKPKALLEYVIVHEMAHLLESTHSERFIAILQKHCPSWRDARAELNELPLRAEAWKE